jgi:hypothetical protein
MGIGGCDGLPDNRESVGSDGSESERWVATRLATLTIWWCVSHNRCMQWQARQRVHAKNQEQVPASVVPNGWNGQGCCHHIRYARLHHPVHMVSIWHMLCMFANCVNVHRQAGTTGALRRS